MSRVDTRSFFARVCEFYRSPFPVRVSHESPSQWIADALIAVLLYVVGCGIAEFCGRSLLFLEPISSSVASMIGLFPIGIWAHYCRVLPFTRLTVVLSVLLLLGFRAGALGWHGLYSLPLAGVVLLIALSCECLLGKLLLGNLPSSSTRKRIEKFTGH